MTETTLVDYAWARPAAATIKSDGYAGVLRYIGGGSAGKQLTASEAKTLHAHGLAIGVVFESTANRAAGGRAAGIADARTAVHAADALGVPKSVPIFFAVDFDSNASRVAAYFAGARTVIPNRVGVYGGYNVMGVNVPWKWQTAAWSGGRLHKAAHIFQRAKAAHSRLPSGCDQNVVCKPITLWGPKGAVTVAPPGAANPAPARKPAPKAGPNVVAAIKAVAKIKPGAFRTKMKNAATAALKRIGG